MLEVKETAYASLDKDSVDMRNADNRFTIMIDQSKLDKMALNPITVRLSVRNLLHWSSRFILSLKLS